MDAILATAHTLSQRLICQGCEQPWIEAWNPDAEGYYEIRENTCYACLELEQHDKRSKDADHRRDQHVSVAPTPDHPHEKLRPWSPGPNPS